MGSILEDSPNNGHQTDWPQQQFQNGNGGNISDIEQGPFSGMVVGKSKKKRSSSNKKKAEVKAQLEMQRKQQMKMMAEEAAARSRAAGHAPLTPKMDFSSKFDFPDEDGDSFGDNSDVDWGHQPARAPQEATTTTAWEMDFSQQQHSQSQQNPQREQQQQYKLRKSQAPPWSKQQQSQPPQQQHSSSQNVHDQTNSTTRQSLKQPSPRRPSASREVLEQKMQRTIREQNVPQDEVLHRTKSKPPSPRRPSPFRTVSEEKMSQEKGQAQQVQKKSSKPPSPRRPSPTRQHHGQEDQRQSNVSAPMYASTDIGVGQASARGNNASLLKQRFAKEQEKRRMQQHQKEEQQQQRQEHIHKAANGTINSERRSTLSPPRSEAQSKTASPYAKERPASTVGQSRRSPSPLARATSTIPSNSSMNVLYVSQQEQPDQNQQENIDLFRRGKNNGTRQPQQSLPKTSSRSVVSGDILSHDSSSIQALSSQRLPSQSHVQATNGESLDTPANQQWKDRTARLDRSPTRKPSPTRGSSPTRRQGFHSTEDRHSRRGEEGDQDTTIEGYENGDIGDKSARTQNSQHEALHDSVRLSPTMEGRTIRSESSMSPVESNLTSSTADMHNNSGRANPFKEMAGFHATKKNSSSGIEDDDMSRGRRSPVSAPWKKPSSLEGTHDEAEQPESQQQSSRSPWSRDHRPSPSNRRPSPPPRENSDTPVWMQKQDEGSEKRLTRMSEVNGGRQGDDDGALGRVTHFVRSDPGGGKRDSPASTAAKASWRERVAKQQRGSSFTRVEQEASEPEERHTSIEHESSGTRSWRTQNREKTSSGELDRGRESVASSVPPWAQKRLSSAERNMSDDRSIDSASQASLSSRNDAEKLPARPSWQEAMRERQRAGRETESPSEKNPDSNVASLPASKTWQQKLKERPASATQNSLELAGDDTASVDSTKHGARSDFVVGSTYQSIQSNPLGLSIKAKLKANSTARNSPLGATPPIHPNKSPRQGDVGLSNTFLSKVKLRRSSSGGLDELLKNVAVPSNNGVASSNACSQDNEQVSKERISANEVKRYHRDEGNPSRSDHAQGRLVSDTTCRDSSVVPQKQIAGGDPRVFRKATSRLPKIDTTMLEELQSVSPPVENYDEEATCCDSLQATIEGGRSPSRDRARIEEPISPKEALNTALLRRMGGSASNKMESTNDEEEPPHSDMVLDKDALNASLLKRLGHNKPRTNASVQGRQAVSENGVSPRDALNAALLKRMAPPPIRATEDEETATEEKEEEMLSPKEMLNAALLKRTRPSPQSAIKSFEQGDGKGFSRKELLRAAPPQNNSKGDSTKDVLNAALLKRSAPSPPSTSGTVLKNESASPVSPSSQLPQQNNEELAKFFKMLKFGMPVDVVRHAMVRDGVDPELLDGRESTKQNCSSEFQPQSAKDASDGPVPLKNDPKYEKYFKMLKMGLPLQVVKHAMVRDGMDDSVMDGDHNAPAPGSSAPRAPALKDDPQYEKYFKMLKMGLPMEAVKHAMSRDGVDPSVMDEDQSKPAGGGSGSPRSRGILGAIGGGVAAALKAAMSGGPKAKPPAKPKDTVRRMRIHWNTMEQESVPNNSVWALLNSDPEAEELDIDETEFKELFQAEIKEKKATLRSEESTKKNVVKVIDSKKANNGGIILARIKMSFDEVADSIERL
jgi:hypothetical protein